MGLVRSTLVTVLSFGLTRGVGIVTGFLLVYALNPEEKGPFDLMVQVIFFGQAVGSLGLGYAVILLVGQGRISGDRASRALQGTLAANGILLAVVLTTALWVLLRGGSFDRGPLAAVPFAILVIMIWTIPLRLYQMAANAVHLASDRILSYNLVLFAPEGSFLVLLAIVLYTGQGTLEAISVAKSVAFACGAITATLLLRRTSPIRPRLDRAFLAEAVPIGMRFYFSWILRIANQRLDLFLVATLTRDPVAVGLYSLALGLAEMLIILPDQIAPVFVAWFSREEPETTRAPVIARHMLLLSIAAALALLALAEPLVLLLNLNYLDCLPTFRLLLVGMVPMSVARVLFANLQGRGRPGLPMQLDGLALVLVVVLDLLLIPDHGILGAGIAHATAYVVTSFATLLIFRNVSGAGLLQTLVLRRSDLKLWRSILGPKIARIRRKR